MTINQKPTGVATSISKGLFIGLLFTLLVFAMQTMLLAILIANGRLDENKLGYGIMIILFSSSVIGSVVSVRYTKRRILYVTVLYSISFLMLLSLSTMLFFNGRFDSFLPTAALIFTGGMMPILFLGRPKRNKNQHKRKMKNR